MQCCQIVLFNTVVYANEFEHNTILSIGFRLLIYAYKFDDTVSDEILCDSFLSLTLMIVVLLRVNVVTITFFPHRNLKQ